MDIKEIANELTREEFEKCFKEDDDRMGIYFEYNNIMYTCPEDLRLTEVKHCQIEGEYICKQCWLNSIQNIKFKGEE